MTNVPFPTSDSPQVLALEEIGRLAEDTSKPAETLMNVVALIARRFRDRCLLGLSARAGPRQSGAGRHPRSAQAGVGTLRMALHEGLAGWSPNRCGRSPSDRCRAIRASSIPRSRRRRLPVLPRRSADRSRRSAGRAGGADDRSTRLPRRRDPDADGSGRAGGAGGQRGAHTRPLHRACAGTLWALARNLWWSWDHDSTGLFRDLDPVRWRQLNHNPIALLSEMPLADHRAPRQRAAAAQPHQLRVPPPAGISAG